MNTNATGSNDKGMQSRGFMYIGTAPCGCITGMAWDDADAKKSNATFVAKLIRRGDSVTRVEVLEDSIPPLYDCEKHAAERAERARMSSDTLPASMKEEALPQPSEAIRLAEIFESFRTSNHCDHDGTPMHLKVAAELRRLDALAARAGMAPAKPVGAAWQAIDENYFVSRDGLLKDAKGNLLGQWKNNQGYMLARLSSPRRVERVHRLVAAAFAPNPRGADTVNHIDCDRANNNASNLEWCTQAENLQHSSDLGRMQRNYWSGRRSPNAGLTDEQVRLMRSEYSTGRVTFQKLADQFGVSKRCVGRVINMEAYRDVQ